MTIREKFTVAQMAFIKVDDDDSEGDANAVCQCFVSREGVQTMLMS